MAKEEKASQRKCKMRPFLALLEDEFEEESTENRQGKTFLS